MLQQLVRAHPPRAHRLDPQCVRFFSSRALLPSVCGGRTDACLSLLPGCDVRACVRACATQDVLNFLVFHVFLTYVHYSRETVRRLVFALLGPSTT